MRIGLVSPYSLTVPGGVQSQVLALGRALRATGHKVRVLGPCDGAPPEPGITPLGNSIPTAANGSVAPIAPDPSCALRTIRALRDEQFDVVHLHEPLVPGPCETVLMLNNVTTVGTWHAAGGSVAYRVPGTRVLANRISHRVAVSQDAMRMAVQGLGGTYTVLWNGIETNRFDEFCTEYNTPNQGYGGFSCHMSYCFGARRLESHVMKLENRSSR